MRLSWFNTSMGTHKQYQAYEYEQYKVMKDMREIEFRDSESNANNKICFEVRATALRSCLHTEGFYVHIGPSTKGPPPKNCNSTPGVHNSSLKYNHLYTRGTCKKANHNHPYTRGTRHKAKLNHLYTREIRYKANTQPQSPLHKRDRHKPKAKKRLQSW